MATVAIPFILETSYLHNEALSTIYVYVSYLVIVTYIFDLVAVVASLFHINVDCNYTVCHMNFIFYTEINPSAIDMYMCY